MNRVLQAVCRAAAEPEPTDGQLLAAYAGRRDEAAFAELVRRHGPMVWGVCRRALGRREDAEDAFQATFLVLVRKPGSVRPADRVGNWLHGVAVRAARKAARTVARRREQQVLHLPEPETVAEGVWHDLIPVLDEEVGRLPEKYRLPVVLCDLEGNTRREAARRLGWPEGTVAGRLALARAMLARRLTLRGLPVSGGVLAAVLAGGDLSAAVPGALFDHTVRTAAGGASRPGAAALAEGVIRAMSATRGTVLAAVLAAAALSGGVALWAQPGGPPAGPAGPADPAPAKEAAVDVAWGQAVDGLQSGVGFAPGQKGPHRVGDTAKLVVYLRNVGGKERAVEYSDRYLAETQPTVVDAAGKQVATSPLPFFDGLARLLRKTLAPGEVVELGRVERVLEPAREPPTGRPTLFVGPGRYKLSYANVPPGRLATGALDLEVVADPPGVAWGKAEGGVRLGLRPAGPTRLSVVVENVGPADAVLNLGIMLANGKTQFPTAVRLAVTDAAGKSRTFVRRVGGIAGRVDPFVVPLPAGGQYILPFALADLIDADNPGTPLAPGAYKVAAEFTGEKVARTNADSGGLALMPYWTGTLRSGAVDVVVPAVPPLAAGPEAPVEFRWGEAVKGLQAGIGVGGGRVAYRYGEEVPLRVNVRNVGAEPVAVRYSSALLRHTQPEVEDGAGRRVTGAGENRLLMPPAVRYVIPVVDRELKAGEEMSFGLVPLKLTRPGAQNLGQSLELQAAPGEYTIRYTVALGTGQWPVTGRLRFAVQPTDGGE
ncbi:MAG TPA: sigma-70 family RNA polymerase sigma factor [Urbifossiella sp.]|nr:sigma-70 family RNA polymerase sigma factor [Urbifossiella sp.]